MNEILTELLAGAIYDAGRVGVHAFWQAAVGSSQNSWREVFLVALDKALHRLSKSPTAKEIDGDDADDKAASALWLYKACKSHGASIIESWPSDEIAKLPHDEEALWRLVRALIAEEHSHDKNTEESRLECLREHLFPLYKSELSELLIQEPYQAAWRACLFQWLVTTRDEFRQTAANLSDQQEKQAKITLEVAERLNALAHIPNLLNNLTLTASKSLETENARFDLCDALDEVRGLVLGEFVSDNGSLSPVLSDIPLRRRRIMTAKPCIGREEIWEDWTTSLKEGGLWLVTTPAGGGKSTAVAHWLDRVETLQTDSSIGPAVCSHFFERNDTHGFWGGLTIIGEQLLAAHGIKGRLSQSETTQLQTAIRLLLEKAHPAGLLVVLDGIDEAWGPYSDSGDDTQRIGALRDVLPEQLGEGVTVFLTLRAIDGHDTAENFRRILNPSQLRLFEMPPLSKENIGGWLKTLCEQSEFLPDANESEYWAEQIHSRTGGLPIYVHHLIEQLSSAATSSYSIEERWQRILNTLPREFERYVQSALDHVASRQASWRDALRFLALARGPLSQMDLLELTERSGAPLQPEDWHAMPWEIRRWLERHEASADDASEALDTSDIPGTVWKFAHEAIAQAFISGPERSAPRKKYKEYLLDFCGDWQKHESAYAIRHTAAHLLDAKRWSDVYELVDNKDFRHIALRVLSDEPKWELTLIRCALTAALASDDAARAVEFLLQYRSHIKTLGWVHPVRALEVYRPRDCDKDFISLIQLRCAWRIADLYPQEDARLWDLLLVARLYATGNDDLGKQAFDRLLNGASATPRKWRGWRADFAIYLLEELLELLPTPSGSKEEIEVKAFLVCVLGMDLLDEYELPKLAKSFEASGDATWGFLLLIGIEGVGRRHALCSFAKSIYQENLGIACLCLQAAYKDAQEVEQEDIWRGYLLKDIVEAFVEIGFPNDALRIAGEIRSWPDHIAAHGAVAMAASKSEKEQDVGEEGNTTEIENIWDPIADFTRWQDMIASWEDGYWKWRSMKELSIAWMKIGRESDALKLLSLLPSDECESATTEICEALSQSGNLTAAQQFIKKIEGDWRRGDAWMTLADKYLAKGDTKAAQDAYSQTRTIFENLKNEDDWEAESRNPSLKALALSQVKAGFYEDAQATLVAINGLDWKAEGWHHNVDVCTSIACSHAQRGEFDAAWDQIKSMPINRGDAIVGVMIEELKAGKWGTGELIFHKVEHLCRRSKPAGARLALETAKICRTENRKTDAYEVLSRAIGEYEEQAASWHALSQSLVVSAEVLLERGQVEEAKQLLQRAVRRNQEYSLGPGWFQDFFLRKIADLQIKINDFDGTQKTIDAMATEFARKETEEKLASHVNPQVTEGGVKSESNDDSKLLPNADVLAKQAQQSNDPIQAAEFWSHAAEQCLASGDERRAREYYGSAVDAALRVENEEERDGLIGAILEDQARLGQPQEAAVAAKKHLDNCNRIFEVASIELWKQNRRKEALALLAEIDNLLIKATVETIFARWQFQSGEIDEARHSLRELLRRARRREFEEWGGRALEQIGVGLAQAGLAREALETSLLIPSQDDRERSWPNIAKALIEVGDQIYWKQLAERSIDLDVAPWAICGLFAKAYPGQAETVGEALSRHTPGQTTRYYE